MSEVSFTSASLFKLLVHKKAFDFQSSFKSWPQTSVVVSNIFVWYLSRGLSRGIGHGQKDAPINTELHAENAVAPLLVLGILPHVFCFFFFFKISVACLCSFGRPWHGRSGATCRCSTNLYVYFTGLFSISATGLRVYKVRAARKASQVFVDTQFAKEWFSKTPPLTSWDNSS